MQLIRDLRIGVRVLRQHASTTAVAIATLALGIGVSTALFSVVYGVWLNAYPYRQADGIVYPRARATNGQFADSQNGVYEQREFLEIARLPAVADAMANTLYRSVQILGDHGPEDVPSIQLSGRAFQFLGVPPLLGRTLQPSDILPGGDAEHVAVLSFNLWRRMFHSDASVVGRRILLSDVPYVIVGVMPHRFGWGAASIPTNDGVWLPLPTNDTHARLRAWVRLRSDVTEAVAVDQFHALFVALAKTADGSFPRATFTTDVRRFALGTGDTARYVTQMRASLRLLLFAVGFLLLIACTNVANLQLARGSARSRELAIRQAVGASRWSLFRQLLTENMLLSLVAGALGILVASGLTRVITLFIPRGYVPSESEIAMNVPVLVAGLVTSLLSGIVFGLLPAVQHSKQSVNDVLKDTVGGAGGLRGGRARNLLVVAEVALSVVLLTAASLAVRGYISLGFADLGFDPQRLFEVGVLPPDRSNDAAAQATAGRDFLRDLPGRVEQLPTVESATTRLAVRSRPWRVAGEDTTASVSLEVQAVGPSYLRTMGMQVRAGRDFVEPEMRRGDAVALVNDAAAQLWSSGRSALGGHVTFDALPGLAAFDVTILGVVKGGLGDAPRPVLYIPYSMSAPASGLATLVVRTRHDQPLNSADAVRAQVFAFEPKALLLRPVDVALQAQAGRLQPRFNMVLFGGLAVTALLLAGAGIYAVLSFRVARQRREIGIRLALGAGPARVTVMVLAGGAWLVGAGLAIGVLASVVLGRIVKSQVFVVPESDTVALMLAVTALALVAVAACLIPARRASRVSPLDILRSE